MKLLVIRDGKGFYRAENGAEAPVDQLTKEDLLRLVGQVLTGECEMDELNAELLQNQAHRIIYENVWSKLVGLRSRRKEFVDESKRLYLTEYERYRISGVDTTQRDDDAPQAASAS